MIARVTTVIPTFCRSQLLERAVSSALSQGDKVRVSVFDNASTDNTEAEMRQLAAATPQLRYHRHVENLGGIANFEYGLRKVETEFFSVLSDDDYLLPGFYAEALRALDECPEAMFWAGCTLHVDESNVVIEARVATWMRHGVYSGPEGVMAMTHGRAPTWTGIVFRRAVLEQLGLPDRRALGPSDLDFVLRAAAHWSFIISPHPSAVFTLNSTSFSSTQPLSSFWPGWLHMIENVRSWTVLNSDSQELIAGALEADARRMLFRRGVFALTRGRRDFAREASSILRSMPRARLPGWALGAGLLATYIPFVRLLLATVYRRLERRLVSQRGGLQQRYGHLLKTVS